MVKKQIISKWNTVRIRDELYHEVEKILHESPVKKHGISSISQFVTNSIADKLDEYSGKKPSYSKLENKLDLLLKQIEKLEDHIMKTEFREIPSTNNNFKSVIVKDTYIEIFDNDIRNGIPIKITYDDKQLHCEECKFFNCNHIKHVWSIEHISNQLEKRGLTIIEKTCPKCGTIADKTDIDNIFGYRKDSGKTITQSWCRYCRTKSKN